MVSDTVIGIFFKTAELPPITKLIDMTKIHAENQNGGHEPEVHI